MFLGNQSGSRIPLLSALLYYNEGYFSGLLFQLVYTAMRNWHHITDRIIEESSQSERVHLKVGVNDETLLQKQNCVFNICCLPHLRNNEFECS